MDKCKICGLTGEEQKKFHKMLKEIESPEFDEEFVKEMMKSDT